MSIRIIKKLLNEVNQHDSYDGMNEVFPNLYLGDRSAALNKKSLQKKGITSVLNAAQGKFQSQINTNQEYYDDVNMRFLGFSLFDERGVDIDKYFEEAAKFIHESINDNGKTLVHCYQGKSRSATLVLAYLMIYQKMSIEQAIRQVTAHRFVFPNDGFIANLISLEERLVKKK